MCGVTARVSVLLALVLVYWSNVLGVVNAQGADTCDTMLLQQQCTVPTTCAGLTSYLACTATLNCQSDPAVSQVIADLRECFGTAGSDNGNGAPQMWTTNGTLYLQAGNDIVFQTKTASSNNNDHPVSVTDIKGVLSTLPTLALKGDVQRVNDTVTDVEGALRTEISTTSEVVTDALVPRFSSMEAAIARSFAAINASLAATWSSLDGVNASLTDSIQDVQRHVNRAAAEASMATGELSQEVSTLFEGMGGVVGELTSKLSASESTQTSQADTLLQVQGQISTILSKQADFAAFQKASSRGLVPDSPASTCGEVTSKDDGVYYFSTSTGVFTAFCDFQRDGGKWAKVLQYPGQNYVGWTDDSTGSVGNIATKDLVSSFSKLSDVQINSIKSSASDFRVWKIESGCTNNNLYIITPHSYVDTRIDLGLALDEVHIHCLAPTLAECDGNWNTGDMRGYDNGGGLNLLDTYYVSGDLDQSCNRFFFGHRGSDNHYTCYGPSDNSRRCMSAGSQCTCGSSSNYPPHKDFTIWVKPLDESTVNLVDGLLPDSPAQSCSTVLSTGLTRSQAYYLRAGDNVFRGFCDQTGADGGWLKVLHGAGYQYRDSWTAGNSGRALGDVSQESVSGLARLSDNTINAYLAGKAPFVYRFQSDCTSSRLFLKTGRTYDDDEFGMNLFYGGAVGCLHTSKCTPSNSGVLSTYPDANAISGNNCNRYFQGHLGTGYPYSCYSTNERSTSHRCFSAGSSCTCGQGVDHPVHKNLQIFVKPFSEF